MRRQTHRHATNEVNTRDRIGRGKKTIKEHHKGKLSKPVAAPKMKNLQKKPK